MSGETRFAFYTSTSGSVLGAANIGTGSIQTVHLSASSVTPSKADLTGTWDFSSGSLRTRTAVSSSEVVIKSQLDAALAGVTGSEGPSPMKGSVRLVFRMDDETASAFTYDNDAKTLTSLENFNLNGGMIGGITDFAPGQRFLVQIKPETTDFNVTGSWAGVYDITQVGADDPGGSPIIFTRSSNFDTTSDVLSGSFGFAQAIPGDGEDGEGGGPGIFYLETSGSVTLGTTPLTFGTFTFSEGAGNAAKGAVRGVISADDETVELFTYDEGQQTLTFNGNASLNGFGIGGHNDLSEGDRLLVTVQEDASSFVSSGSWGGIYDIVRVGQDDPGGESPVLKRSSDFNSTEKLTAGSFVFATVNQEAEDANGYGFWYLHSSGSLELDSSVLSFVQYEVSGSGGGGGGGTTYSADGLSLALTANTFSIAPTGVNQTHFSSSLYGLGITQGSGIRVGVSVDGSTITISGALDGNTRGGTLKVNDQGIGTNQLANGGVTPEKLNVSTAGPGLVYSGPGGLAVSVDNSTIFVSGTQVSGSGSSIGVRVNTTDFNNPLTYTTGGLEVRPATSMQSGYMTTASYQQLAAVISYSAVPTTIGGVVNAVTTSNTQTAAFNVGAVPANAFWTVRFTTFSVDTTNPVNQVSYLGAFQLYRSGSNNVERVGNIEVEHAFVSGTFTEITMSTQLAFGQPGNVDLTLQGINLQNIKHWATFKVTEFVYA